MKLALQQTINYSPLIHAFVSNQPLYRNNNKNKDTELETIYSTKSEEQEVVQFVEPSKAMKIRTV